MTDLIDKYKIMNRFPGSAGATVILEIRILHMYTKDDLCYLSF